MTNQQVPLPTTEKIVGYLKVSPSSSFSSCFSPSFTEKPPEYQAQKSGGRGGGFLKELKVR